MRKNMISQKPENSWKNVPRGTARRRLALFFFFFFFFFNNIYLVTTLLMTILTFTWRKNKTKVQEIKEKYDATAFATN